MRSALVFLIVFALLGCATVGTRVSKENFDKIKEGQTTKAQVIELLGGPSSSTLTSDGKEILMYHSVKATSAPQNFIPFVGLVQTRMDMEQQITNVLISKDGLVEKVSMADSKSAIKSGLITD